MDFDPDFEGVDFEDVLLPIVTAIVEGKEEESRAKQACQTGVEELLNCGHEVRIYGSRGYSVVLLYGTKPCMV